MNTPLQLRFVSLAHPSWRAYLRSRHPLLSMFLVLAPLTCQLRNGFLPLFTTQRRPRKYRGLALNATRTLRSTSPLLGRQHLDHGPSQVVGSNYLVWKEHSKYGVD